MKTKFFFLSVVAGVAISVLASCGGNCTTCSKSGDPYTYEVCDDKLKVCYGGTCSEAAFPDSVNADAYKSYLEASGYTCN